MGVNLVNLLGKSGKSVKRDGSKSAGKPGKSGKSAKRDGSKPAGKSGKPGKPVGKSGKRNGIKSVSKFSIGSILPLRGAFELICMHRLGPARQRETVASVFCLKTRPCAV